MLDTSIKEQLKIIFQPLEHEYILHAIYQPQHENAQELVDFLKDIAGSSEKITCEFATTEENRIDFQLYKNGKNTGINFHGMPNGHEFTSLLLAILNADGKGKNLPDQVISDRIKALKGPIALQTYVSLTCTNCPDVVQALNIMALLNENITHEMIDGGIFEDEVKALNIQGVPTVLANGKQLHVGRGELGELLEKLEKTFGAEEQKNIEPIVREYDVLVLGGGPAGASAAIYSARKGLKVAIVAERTGGQLKETVGIENMISVPQTTGTQLADALKNHISQYPIDLYENRKIIKAELSGREKVIDTASGERFLSPCTIIATGASWRKLNIEGETEYIGKGVAFCPHCDGPFYKGKHVAVVGGGNSGVEAAIDLAGICSKVTLFEFLDTLKADQVLQDKVRSMPNIEVFVSSQTTKVLGDGNKVTGIRVKDRNTNEEKDYDLDGIFVQIGLAANSAPFREQLEVTSIGEIKIDANCRTDISGVYAAGDVSNVPFKQIVIAMGEGAKAALSAFEDLIHGKFK